MNFKQFGFGMIAAAAMVAGSTLATTPAQAATLKTGAGDLNFDGEARFEVAQGGVSGFINFRKFGSNGYKNNLATGGATGQATIGASSGGVFADLQDTIAILRDLTLTKVTPANPNDPIQYTLGSAIADFITLSNGVKFQLDSFLLTKTPVKQGDLPVWVASYTGFFSGGIFGNGQFSTQGKFQTSTGGGSTYSSSIAVIPTPAMLPGLLALSVAALRKRKEEEAEEIKVEIEAGAEA